MHYFAESVINPSKNILVYQRVSHELEFIRLAQNVALYSCRLWLAQLYSTLQGKLIASCLVIPRHIVQ